MTTKLTDHLRRRGWSKVRCEIFLKGLTGEQLELLESAVDDPDEFRSVMDQIADDHDNKA